MPDWKSQIRQRLAQLQLAPTRENAIVEELAAHLDELYVELRASGVSEAEAQRQMLAELSESELLTRELRRVERQVAPEPVVLGTNRRTNMIADLWQDLRFGARLLRKQPGFTLLAILTLALGIGANTAIFSVINAVLLRPLPYTQPEQLVSIYDNVPSLNIARAGVNEGEVVSLRSQNQGFAEVAAWYSEQAALRGVAEPERIIAPRATANFFRTLGVRMALGRDFLPEEETMGKNNVVVLTHQFWQRKFSGDPAIIGRTLTLDENGYTVIGVLPDGFRAPGELAGTRRNDAWRGFDLNPARPRRGSTFLNVVARLRPGGTLASAQAEAVANTRREAMAFPDFYPSDITSNVEPLTRTIVGDVQQSLWMLLAAVAVVLLIVCANVASLLLVRGEARQKEIAVRAALGAERGRIIRQLLAESMLLALLGGGLGVLLARWSLAGLLAISPSNIPRLMEASLDARVLMVAFVVSLLTAVIFGLAPALQAVKFDLHTTLKESGRGSQPVNRSRLRKALVVTETALAVVLLVAAGLLLRSLRELQRVNTGFRPDHLLTMTVTPYLTTPEAVNQQAFQQSERVLNHLQTVPGVVAAAASDTLPLGGGESNTAMEFAGRPFDMKNLTNMTADFGVVSPAYFQTVGMQLLRGRNFTEADHANALPVVIINETMARNHWPNEDPLGERFRLLDAPPERATTQFLTVVGIVADAKNRTLTEAASQEAFVPFAQRAAAYERVPGGSGFILSVRTTGDPAQLSSTIQRELRQLDSNLILASVGTMDQVLTNLIVQPRFQTILLSCFALLGLGLGLVGIYGVLASIVAQRTQEIGIRLALGAQPRDVLRLVLREGMGLSGLGIGLGLLLAFGMTRLLNKFLFGVSATDPLTFAGIALLLLAVALIACWIPARRATKVDPMIVLRTE